MQGNKRALTFNYRNGIMTDRSVTQKVVSPEKETIDAPCKECKRTNKHHVLTSVEVDGEDHFGDNSVQYELVYRIIQCGGCETISYMTRNQNSEDWDFDENNNPYWNVNITYYPNRNEGKVPMKDSMLLPGVVQRIYEETINAINNDQAVLAGIGLRALVESVCKQKQAPGRNLAEKIDGLVDLGVLPRDGASILHKVRTMGNDAAHEVKPHKPEQLNLALGVCEHLLQGVYLLPMYAARTFGENAGSPS
jgi:Domain of unknown function (DUF4145)